MKMFKREKIALGLAIAGIVWWIAENCYFGWHMTPQSPLEGVADFLVWVLWVLAYFIRPTRIEFHEQSIHTNTVEILKANVRTGKKQTRKGSSE